MKRILTAIVFAAFLPIISSAKYAFPLKRAAGFNESLNTVRALYQKRNRSRPLWAGSRFTEADRARALRRGLKFIYRTALNKRNFAEYGHDYLWCFYTIGTSVQDAGLREMAQRMGIERARRWRRDHPGLPENADAGMIANYTFGCDAADSLGVRDDEIKEQMRRAAARFTARDYLRFDPVNEPPPVDVPDECGYCQAMNIRGSQTCRVCKRPLKMRSRYDVWYDALITAYVGEHYGVRLGARYVDVLKWLPVLRPYRGSENGANTEFYDEVYAITHIVYTLNNYSMYRLKPAWLPQEYAFLKANLKEAIRRKDSDMLGEFMDSLKAFGLTSDDPDIRAGMEYLLSHQNRDGSWGFMREKDIYDRYHPTWNGVAGLSEYAWQGERLSFPEAQALLEQETVNSRQ
ncbi:MAG TPA: hypothetical protein VF708_13105 [Pyrinomonadaceae bacterium]|jgi:hypothetical protein